MGGRGGGAGRRGVAGRRRGELYKWGRRRRGEWIKWARGGQSAG